MEKQITIKINGLHCDHCVKRVQTSLKAFKEIKKVNIDLERGKALITLKKDLDHDVICKAICDLGYTAEKV